MPHLEPEKLPTANQPVPVHLPTTPQALVGTALLGPGDYEGAEGHDSAGATGRSSYFPSPGALLYAFRKRYLLALTLGVLLASVAGFVVWQLAPAKFTAFAMVRVASSEHQVLATSHPSSHPMEMGVYRETQLALVKSQRVIGAALKKDKVRELPTLQNAADPAGWVMKELKATMVEGTEILTIALSGEMPEDLPIITNAIVEAYLSEIVNLEQNRKRARLNELDQIASASEEKLRKQREKLRQLAESLGTSDSDALTHRQRIALEAYAALKAELIRVQAELRRARENEAVLQARLKAGDSVEIPADLFDLHLEEELSVRSARLDLHRAEEILAAGRKVAKDVSAQEKAVMEAKKAIEVARFRARAPVEARLRKSIRTKAQTELNEVMERVAVLDSQQKTLAAEVEKRGAEADRIGTTSIEIHLRRDEIEQAEHVIRNLKGERERLQVEMQSTFQRVTPLQAAEVPTSRNSRPRLMMTLLAVAGSMVLGVVGVCWWECRGGKITSADELVTGLPVKLLGTVPPLPAGRAEPAFGTRSGQPYPPISMADAISGIRTVLLREPSFASGRVILVSSAGPGEGKTTLASHLAASLTSTGRKTLLIDADLRRPALHRVFELPPGPGLAELLAGTAQAGAVIQPTPIAGLLILTAGEPSSRAIQALAQATFAKVLDDLRTQYDFIIIDSCPILPMADSLIVAQHVDAVVLSVRQGVSQLPQVRAAYQRLKSARIPVLGTVVSGVPARTYSYYHSPERSETA